jgi:hypothetical protein
MRTRGALALALAVGVGALAVVPPTVADESTTAETVSIVRVATPTWEDRDRLVGLNLDLTEHGGPGFVEVVVHGGLDRQRLTAAGFTWTVQVPDLALTTAQSNRETAAYAASVATSPLPSGRDTYRTLADYERDLDALAAKYPGHVKRSRCRTAPTRAGGVKGVEITENVAASDGKPVFLIMGCTMRGSGGGGGGGRGGGGARGVGGLGVGVGSVGELVGVFIGSKVLGWWG